MKKLIVLSLIMAVMFLTGGSGAPARAQDPANADKPTFYHLVPGTYVNGWPRFTITYPKDWVEGRLLPRRSFAQGFPGPLVGYCIHVSPSPFRAISLDKVASYLMLYGNRGQRRDCRKRQAIPDAGRHPGPGG